MEGAPRDSRGGWPPSSVRYGNNNARRAMPTDWNDHESQFYQIPPLTADGAGYSGVSSRMPTPVHFAGAGFAAVGPAGGEAVARSGSAREQQGDLQAKLCCHYTLHVALGRGLSLGGLELW